jgi:hypothetical protein
MQPGERSQHPKAGRKQDFCSPMHPKEKKMNKNMTVTSTISDRIEMAISQGISSEQISAVLMVEAGLLSAPGIVIDQKSIETLLSSYRN